MSVWSDNNVVFTTGPAGESVLYAQGVSIAAARMGVVEAPLQGEEYDPKFIRMLFEQASGFSPAVGDTITRGGNEYRVVKVRDDGAGCWRINAERG